MSGVAPTMEPEDGALPGVVAGERGAPVVARARSLQTRLRQGFAGLVLTLVAAGFLAWYYTRLAGAEPLQRSAAERARRAMLASELKLPPLPTLPGTREVPHIVPDVPPPNDPGRAPEWLSGPAEPTAAEAARAAARREAAAARVMAAPVWVAVSSVRDAPGAAGEAETVGVEHSPGRMDESVTPLARALRPTVLAASAAGVVPTARFLLPKGSFIDCTLETAIDSTLPGLVTCLTAVDVFGADGSVVLLERGSKLIGEIGQGVRIGQRRLFVVWNEARTPAGIVVPLGSPGTDALGRAGLGGSVDSHFGERFGAALLISIIEGVSEVASASQRDGAVFIDPRGVESVSAEIIRRTADIPPTIRVAPGARVSVLVARDVDFRRVYALKSHDTTS